MRDYVYAISPALGAFGPIIIVLAIPMVHLWQSLLGLLGALAVGFCLISIILRQRRIEQRMDKLAVRTDTFG